MGLDKSLVRAVRNLDEYELRRLVIYASDLLDSAAPSEADGDGDTSASSGATAQGSTEVRVRSQRVRCSKPSCTRCPHGPYWYAYWREGGRARSRYLGKRLPEEYRR
ncbi:MAG: hypothetical protein DCC49_06175 [Acidobacteria bacterium]|nr:MAG: hypothetical protein DCC49_06175 [Acidobacteriota bacterium]